MHALWRRIVFSILVSNTDDHLRNHGFLCPGPAGWRLSPAYDLNPIPVDLRPRVLEQFQRWCARLRESSLRLFLRKSRTRFRPLGYSYAGTALTTAINEDDGTASLHLAYEVAHYFELGEQEARMIAREAGSAVASWRKEAAALGLRKAEIDRMASAFEHEDLKLARSGR